MGRACLGGVGRGRLKVRRGLRIDPKLPCQDKAGMVLGLIRAFSTHAQPPSTHKKGQKSEYERVETGVADADSPSSVRQRARGRKGQQGRGAVSTHILPPLAIAGARPRPFGAGCPSDECFNWIGRG